ncbi:unnamed protein product [Linum trigynum]|uniref:FAS1 domain-containing protein n=1 Tax=Linum trigynum TaxID=586398 RepID=A0AAV2CK44_9ROSI
MAAYSFFLLLLIAPGILAAPTSALNVTELLENAGCSTVASLLQSTGVLETFLSSAHKGLTVFAPNDEAFKAPEVVWLLGKLSSAEKVSLLLYHAVPSYKPYRSLKVSKGPIPTLASNGTRKFELTTTATGDEVTIQTGAVASRITSTILDASPLVIFSVDAVLVPKEYSGPTGPAPQSPSPGPAGDSQAGGSSGRGSGIMLAAVLAVMASVFG